MALEHLANGPKLGEVGHRAVDRTKVRELVVFSDSQAAIQAVRNPKRPSGQYVLTRIYDHVRAIRSQRQTPISITIRWIPAHEGVPGNEAADGCAKAAALWGAGAVGDATEAGAGSEEHLIRLASAAKRSVRKRIRERWKKQWERERTARPTRRLIKAPNRKTLELYIGLRHFLYKINETDSDRCGCDQGSQTPRHILL